MIQSIQLYNAGNETVLIDTAAMVFCDGFSIQQDPDSTITPVAKPPWLSDRIKKIQKRRGLI